MKTFLSALIKSALFVGSVYFLASITYILYAIYFISGGRIFISLVFLSLFFLYLSISIKYFKVDKLYRRFSFMDVHIKINKHFEKANFIILLDHKKDKQQIVFIEQVSNSMKEYYHTKNINGQIKHYYIYGNDNLDKVINKIETGEIKLT